MTHRTQKILDVRVDAVLMTHTQEVLDVRDDAEVFFPINSEFSRELLSLRP